MDEKLKNKTLSSLMWQFGQKMFSQFFSFVVTVILARVLVPEDYGVVALASMFNVLVGIFINGSMDASLIQKRDVDELDYNTVFFSSLFMSVLIYLLVYFIAPFFANVYDNPMISPIMRVLALTMPIGALAMVQNASISRNLDFKKFFYATFVGQIIAATVGIVMAYNEYGPWALVAQTIISTVANTLVMFTLVSWHPRWMFSWERFMTLFSFAWKKSIAGFIGTLCDQMKGYLIGGKYTTSDLAYYNRGEGLPDMFRNNIAGTIDAVLFPALSRLNGDVVGVKQGMRRAMMTSSYVLSPIFLGLAAISEQVIPLLYTEKWSPAIPFMQVACLTSCIIVLNRANLESILAIGRSGEVLKLEIYKKPVMIAILAVTVFISPIAISIGMFVYSFYVLYMNTRPNAKYLGYSLSEQINDVKAGLLLSLAMALIVYFWGVIIPNRILALFVQIPVGVLFYLGISHLLELDAYIYVKEIAKTKLNGNLTCKN